MPSAQIVKKSVTNSSSFQNCMYLRLYDHTTDTPGFKPLTMSIFFCTSVVLSTSFNFISQLQAKVAKLMVEKEELMKAVELSSESCNEKAEKEIKVPRIVLIQSGSCMITIYL